MSWLTDRSECQEFLDQLYTFSMEAKAARGIEGSIRGRKRRSWSRGQPQGEIKHYTAGISFWGTVGWNYNRKNRSSSFPFVVDDRPSVEHPYTDQYPLLKKYLPTLVFMASTLEKSHWHGNWTNDRTIGVENRNAGPLKRDGDHYRWWGGVFPSALGKQPLEIDGRYWEPWTVEQIVSNIVLTRVFSVLYRETFNRQWVLPHSAIKYTKIDTGRAFPFQLVREVAFSAFDPWQDSRLKQYTVAPDFALTLEAEEDQAYFDLMLVRYSDEVRDESVGIRPEWDDEAASLIEGGCWRDHLPIVKNALYKLGHDLSWLGKETTNHTEMVKLAVWIFQKSVPYLKDDSIPGPKTRAALLQRLQQFQLEN